MKRRPIANGRMIQEENLPFPHVEYPGLYGTFIGHREAADTPLDLNQARLDALQGVKSSKCP